MTDASRGDAEAAMRHLPRGTGVIFRHYEVPDRAALGARLRAVAKARGLVFLVAGDVRLAARLRADGFHAPEGLATRIIGARRALPQPVCTVAAHGPRGVAQARRMGADAVLISPVFATPSHPGARTLGAVRFAALAQGAPRPIALGGVGPKSFRRLSGAGAWGFAGIGWSGARSRTRTR